MKLNFHLLAFLVAFVCFGLSAAWLFAPHFLVSSWGGEYTVSVGVVGRRVAALFVGLGVLIFAARNAEPSPIRSALVMGFVTALLGTAILGFSELLSNHVSTGILPACLIEITLALAFLYVTRTEKRPAKKENT